METMTAKLKITAQNPDRELVRIGEAILARPRLAEKFRLCEHPNPCPKTEKEETVGINHLFFYPKNQGLRKVWNNPEKPKTACYAVEHAERLQQIDGKLDRNAKWQILFSYRVGKKAPDEYAVRRTLERFKDNRERWDVLYPLDQLVSGQTWDYLSLIRRYQRLEPTQLEDDFEELVLNTLDQLNAAFDQACK
jgi:hypothetical protein